MSIHKSLRSSSGLARARNVLSRTERVMRMTKEGTLQSGDSVLGLPKTKVLKVKKTKGKKKKEEEEEEGVEAEKTEG